MNYLDQLNARLAVKKVEQNYAPISYVAVTSDLVQKYGVKGMHHGDHLAKLQKEHYDNSGHGSETKRQWVSRALDHATAAKYHAEKKLNFAKNSPEYQGHEDSEKAHVMGATLAKRTSGINSYTKRNEFREARDKYDDHDMANTSLLLKHRG